MFNLLRKLVHTGTGKSSESSIEAKWLNKTIYIYIFPYPFYGSAVFLLKCRHSPFLSFPSYLTSAYLLRWDVGPPSASGLPDWHFPPIFYLAAAQPRAPPDGLCLQARPRASAPNKGPCCGAVLHRSTPPPPPPSHSHSHRHAARPEQMEHRRGWLFVQGGSGNGVFAFIHTTHDSFIADLSYGCPSEGGRG